MIAWPKDNQTARNAFYGDPGKGEIPAQMVPVYPPFAMYYDGKRIKAIQFHKKAAPALMAALTEIWDYCGHDQSKIDAAGVSKYAGAYNHRLVRGSTTKWSNHAYAAAIDLNAAENGLYAKGNMPQFVVDAFCRQGAMWGGDYVGRKDAMHFEFVDNGGRKPKSAPPRFTPAVHLFDIPTAAPADEFMDDDDAHNEHEVEKPEPDVNQRPVSDAPNVQPEHATYDLDTEILQRKLVKMNYHELGDADGYFGGKTRGAITAFMNDRGQPTDGTFTPSVTTEVNKAITEGWSRPIAPARANATAKDVAPKVEAVRLTLWQRLGAKITAGLAAVGFTGSTLSSTFQWVQDKMSGVHNFFSHIPPEIWFLIMGIVALVVWYASSKAAESAVKDYNTGRIN